MRHSGQKTHSQNALFAVCYVRNFASRNYENVPTQLAYYGKYHIKTMAWLDVANKTMCAYFATLNGKRVVTKSRKSSLNCLFASKQQLS